MGANYKSMDRGKVVGWSGQGTLKVVSIIHPTSSRLVYNSGLAVDWASEATLKGGGATSCGSQRTVQLNLLLTVQARQLQVTLLVDRQVLEYSGGLNVFMITKPWIAKYKSEGHIKNL